MDLPRCAACGEPSTERRIFTDDGPVIVSNHCECGHVEAFTLSFNSQPVQDAQSRQAKRFELFDLVA